MATQPSASEGPPLWRRLAALLYDGMLVTAIVIAATGLVLPLTGGEALTPEAHPALRWLFRVYLLAVVFAFFAVCWTRGGQTLGMRCWRLRLERIDGGALDLATAARRFGVAAALWILLPSAALWAQQTAAGWVVWIPVLGVLLWSLGARDRDGWHEWLSGTRLAVVPRTSA